MRRALSATSWSCISLSLSHTSDAVQFPKDGARYVPRRDAAPRDLPPAPSTCIRPAPLSKCTVGPQSPSRRRRRESHDGYRPAFVRPHLRPGCDMHSSASQTRAPAPCPPFTDEYRRSGLQHVSKFQPRKAVAATSKTAPHLRPGSDMHSSASQPQHRPRTHLSPTNTVGQGFAPCRNSSRESRGSQHQRRLRIFVLMRHAFARVPSAAPAPCPPSPTNTVGQGFSPYRNSSRESRGPQHQRQRRIFVLGATCIRPGRITSPSMPVNPPAIFVVVNDPMSLRLAPHGVPKPAPPSTAPRRWIKI